MFGIGNKKELSFKEKDENPLPQTVSISIGHKRSIEEFSNIASSIGFNPLELQYEKLRIFLSENNINTYDLKTVQRFLDKKARDENKRWNWILMQKNDQCLNSSNDSFGGYISPLGDDVKVGNFITHMVYTSLIPLKILKTVKTISDVFPTAKFFVSVINNFKDPFIGVTFESVSCNRGEETEIIIFDYWNETGFEG